VQRSVPGFVQNTILAYTKGWIKQSAKDFCVDSQCPGQVRTVHFPQTSQAHYRWSQAFSTQPRTQYENRYFKFMCLKYEVSSGMKHISVSCWTQAIYIYQIQIQLQTLPVPALFQTEHVTFGLSSLVCGFVSHSVFSFQSPLIILFVVTNCPCGG